MLPAKHFTLATGVTSVIILRTFRYLAIKLPWGILVRQASYVTTIHLWNRGFIFFVLMTKGEVLGKVFMLGLVTELGRER